MVRYYLMEASQIIKLLQKQNNRHIHRPQTVDSSTLTWKQQLQSSTHVHGLHTTSPSSCCSESNGQRNYGGQGKQTTLVTGSTQQFPNVFSSAKGSASEIYSSDRILLQQAGKHACAIQQDLDASCTLTSSISLPECYCSNTNLPTDATQINPQNNPYLPVFDTYYRFKRPCDPVIDKNKKHFIHQCHSRQDGSQSQSHSTCDGCIIEPAVSS